MNLLDQKRRLTREERKTKEIKVIPMPTVPETLDDVMDEMFKDTREAWREEEKSEKFI